MSILFREKQTEYTTDKQGFMAAICHKNLFFWQYKPFGVLKYKGKNNEVSMTEWNSIIKISLRQIKNMELNSIIYILDLKQNR